MLAYEKEEWIVISNRCKRPTVEIDTETLQVLVSKTIPESFCQVDLPILDEDIIILEEEQKEVVRPVLIVDRREDYILSSSDEGQSSIEIDIQEELESDDLFQPSIVYSHSSSINL